MEEKQLRPAKDGAQKPQQDADPLPTMKDPHQTNQTEQQLGEDDYYTLNCQQVVIFRLWTGHCRLYAHLYNKIKLGTSPTCLYCVDNLRGTAGVNGIDGGVAAGVFVELPTQAMALTDPKSQLKSLICRFTKEMLINRICNWNCFSLLKKDDIDEYSRKNKLQFADFLVTDLMQDECKQICAKLEILLLQTKLSKKWHAYEMKNIETTQHSHFNKNTLQKSLEKEIKNSRYETDVVIDMKDNSFWIRILLIDPLNSSKAAVRVFFIYYPGTSIILLASFPKKYEEFLKQCLCGVFMCESLEMLPLSGENPDSIASLAISQSDCSNAMTHSSILHSLNPRSCSNTEDYPLNSRIIDEDKEAKENRCKYNKTKFGDDKIPQMKKLTYETETKLHPVENQPDGWDASDMMKCKVTLQGSNVLEGIKGLVNDFIAEAPLPPYLSNITRLGRNYLRIQEKKSN
ncbi:Centromere protein N [Nymphon striatum]|nr:Centromere protein N [Nymphon striatum]